MKFLLSGKVILDAIKEGVKKGSFGYVNEMPDKNDDKYVADINKDIQIDWNGWIVKKVLSMKNLCLNPVRLNQLYLNMQILNLPPMINYISTTE
jgi:hypothetical protein